jgi:glycine/D-amino acid oxidase-like deaminating enzyme
VDPAATSSRAHCAVATTVPPPARPNGVIHGPDLYLRPTADGGVWLEASDIDATVDQTTTDSQLHAAADVLLDRARAVVPALADTELQSARRCIRPLPDDGPPIVGWHPSVEGLYIAVTHSGITLAPHLGRLITKDLLHGDAPALTPYRPDRFTSLVR